MRYRLRTLMVLLALLPAAIAGMWSIYSEPWQPLFQLLAELTVAYVFAWSAIAILWWLHLPAGTKE